MCVLYGVPIGGFSGRLVCQPPYGEERVCDVESRKEGFPDGRFPGHHMGGRRVLTIWSLGREVFRTVCFPDTIWGSRFVYLPATAAIILIMNIVSSVTTFEGMFYIASSFNQPLDSWNSKFSHPIAEFVGNHDFCDYKLTRQLSAC